MFLSHSHIKLVSVYSFSFPEVTFWTRLVRPFSPFAAEAWLGIAAFLLGGAPRWEGEGGGRSRVGGGGEMHGDGSGFLHDEISIWEGFSVAPLLFSWQT